MHGDHSAKNMLYQQYAFSLFLTLFTFQRRLAFLIVAN